LILIYFAVIFLTRYLATFNGDDHLNTFVLVDFLGNKWINKNPGGKQTLIEFW